MSKSITISGTAEVLGEHNTCSNSKEEEDGVGEEIKSDKWEPSVMCRPPHGTWLSWQLAVGTVESSEVK